MVAGKTPRLLNADQIAEAIYKMAQGDESVTLIGQKIGRLNRSLIMKREDIPKELRRVMGEVEGIPAVGITIADQERFLGTLRFHRRLYEQGYFGDGPDVARGWTRQLPGTPGHDAKGFEWTEDAIQNLGVIAGKHTTPEIYDALVETTARQADILQWVQGGASLWRAGKLIYTAPIMRNFYGNALHSVGAGTLSYTPAAQARDLFRAAVELRRYAVRNIGDVGGVVDNAIRDGVLDAEMATSEFRPALEMFTKAAQRRLTGGGSGFLRALAEGTEKLTQMGFRAFDFPDQLWKLDGYIKTTKKLRKALPGAPDEVIRARATRHVLNYFPDYGGVSKGVKAMRGVAGVLTNNFVTYKAEWARIIGGILYRTAAGTPEERAEALGAAFRIAGFTGLMVGIGALMERMHGVNAAEKDALMGKPNAAIAKIGVEAAERAIPESVKAQRPLRFIWGYRDAKGRPEMVDMTYLHPFGDVFQGYPDENPAGRVLNIAARQFLAEGIVERFVSPLAEEMGAEGQTPRPSTGQSLYQFLEPRALLGARRALELAFGPESRLGIFPPAFPKDQPTGGQAFMSEVLGIPVVPIGPDMQLQRDLEERGIRKQLKGALIKASEDPRLTPAERKSREQEAEERSERKQKRYKRR